MTESAAYSYVKSPDDELNRRRKAFALPGNMMFLNTVVQRVAREKEVIVTTVSGVEHVGFITGLDQEYLQLTTTEDQALVVINLLNLESIEETGETLRSLNLDEDSLKKIQTYAQTIFVKAKDITALIRDRRIKRLSDRSRVNTSTDISEADVEDVLED